MPRLPRWFGARSDGESHLWAPDVFRIPAQRDGTRFVMYFTASKAGAHDCIGVALASSAMGPFEDRGRPLRCARHANLIDPSMYQAPGGKRYLAYKAHRFATRTSQIRAIRTTASGIHLVKRAESRPLASGGLVTIEAPQIVNHGRHVWLFVSRRNYADCSYFTQVWRAPSITGRFNPVGGSPSRPGYFDINRRNGGNFCGSGGADLIHDGGTTRIAFHVWQNGVKATGGVRTGWTGRVRWSPSTGLPSMALLP
jgi:arabinan endo-1,5-alpha-L-arabinosidase